MTPSKRKLCFILASVLSAPLACSTSGAPGPAAGPVAQGALQPAIPQAIDVRKLIVIVAPDGRVMDKPLPFDPSSARLQAAAHYLAELAGHVIGFRIDAALLPSLRSSAEDEIAQAMETTAKSLDEFGQDHAGQVAEIKSWIQRIECRYDATAYSAAYDLDDQAAVVQVKVPPEARDLIEHGGIYVALRESWWRRQSARYAKVAPENVPPAEQQAYFDAVTSRRGFRDSQLDTVEGLSLAYPVDPLFKIARLYPLAREPELRTKIRAWLVEAGKTFATLAAYHEKAANASPTSSRFHQAVLTWDEWRKANLGDLDSRELYDIAGIFFHHGAATSSREVNFVTVPGLDPLQFGLDSMEKWARTDTTAQPTQLRKLYDRVVCPYAPDRHGYLAVVEYCDHDFYRYALTLPDRRTRLAQQLLAIQSDRLTQNAVRNSLDVGTVDDVIELTRALEPNEKQWSVALRTIAELQEHSTVVRFFDEGVRLWRAYPSANRRGAVLYLLSQIDGYNDHSVPWERFAEVFGALVSEAEFASFLDQGVHAVTTVGTVGKALSPGWSRADVLVARLDAWLDRPEQERRPMTMSAPDGLDDFVGHLCEDGNLRELARLREFLRTRLQRHPSEKNVDRLAEKAASPRCKRQAQKVASKKHKDGGKSGAGDLFGD